MPKEQFPELMGLHSTMLLKKPQPRFHSDKLVFDREDHWIVISNCLQEVVDWKYMTQFLPQ